MRKINLLLCSVALTMALSGCTSRPSVQPVATQCPTVPAPPAAIMQPPPDLLTPLNGIISSSANE